MSKLRSSLLEVGQFYTQGRRGKGERVRREEVRGGGQGRNSKDIRDRNMERGEG